MSSGLDFAQRQLPKWRKLHATRQVRAYRKGWRGVWDAIKAAVTGKPRDTIAETLTFEVWVHAPEDAVVNLSIVGATIKAER